MSETSTSEIDYATLLAGDNEVAITATDALGETTEHHVTLHYTKDITWEMPYLADFVSAGEIADAGYVGDGRWILTESGVRTAPNGTGYDRFLLVGDTSVADRLRSIFADDSPRGEPRGRTGAGIAVGWQGHISTTTEIETAQPLTDVRYQTIAWIRNFPVGTVLQIRDDETVRADLPVAVQAESRTTSGSAPKPPRPG